MNQTTWQFFFLENDHTVPYLWFDLRVEFVEVRLSLEVESERLGVADTLDGWIHETRVTKVTKTGHTFICSYT